MKKAQVKEFEEMLLKKEFLSVKDPLYRAWLNLKFAASGTETEAIDRLVASKVAKNVPKRKNERKEVQPSGPSRHDPISPEWVTILTKQQAKKKNIALPKRKTPLPRPMRLLPRRRSHQTKKMSSLVNSVMCLLVYNMMDNFDIFHEINRIKIK